MLHRDVSRHGSVLTAGPPAHGARGGSRARVTWQAQCAQHERSAPLQPALLAIRVPTPVACCNCALAATAIARCWPRVRHSHVRHVGRGTRAARADWGSVAPAVTVDGDGAAEDARFDPVRLSPTGSAPAPCHRPRDDAARSGGRPLAEPASSSTGGTMAGAVRC
jgi:hypothetical protein